MIRLDKLPRLISTYDFAATAILLNQPKLVIQALFEANQSCWVQRRELGVRYQTGIFKDSYGNEIRYFSPIGVLKFISLLQRSGNSPSVTAFLKLPLSVDFRFISGIALDFFFNVLIFQLVRQRDSLRFAWESYKRFLRTYK